jgi:hypothetical protein
VQVSVREAFTAPRGRVLVAADYRQIEARVLAHFSEVRLYNGMLWRESGWYYDNPHLSRTRG